MRIKYTNYEKIKITGSSGIYKAIYHSNSYLLSFGKINLNKFGISGEYFLLLRNKCLPLLSAALQLAPHFEASKLNTISAFLENRKSKYHGNKVTWKSPDQ